MKKLMIATLAATAVGGAFATPLVYDYRSSVKHMYEKEARSNGTTVYVKYVKTSKLEGYFIQDVDGTSTLANSDLVNGIGLGTGLVSEKRGFLVVINRSAERDFRRPKIMPAQLDVKTSVTSVSGSGSTTRTQVIAEAYFYAGSFACIPDTETVWDALYDGNVTTPAATDYMFYSGAAVGAPVYRSYGTSGSTLYLFGQHNTYNRFVANDSVTPNTTHQMATLSTGIYAFGDAWLNGAGFGKGSATSTLCCGWGAVDGGFGTISGNLKGGLFLCSIGGNPVNSRLGFFALGLEDVFRNDVGNLIAGGPKVQNGQDFTIAEADFDEYLWADGDIALATTDVVSGSWTLRPRTTFDPVTLTATEIAWFNKVNADGNDGDNTLGPAAINCQEVLEYVKAANRLLDRNYSLTVGGTATKGSADQPENRNGRNTVGLIPYNFAQLFL